jgi:hypothetical protein
MERSVLWSDYPALRYSSMRYYQEFDAERWITGSSTILSGTLRF